jgi:acetylornithine deacetylase/succinyl-diaminopimelate desuccinylase-like protein
MVDSPAWHLIKALDTLVSEDGNTITIDDYPKPRPLTARELEIIATETSRSNESTQKKLYGVKNWIDDLPWPQARERLMSQPTVNIQGLVGGYAGPGGKTILPHRAVAKIDMRLVPDMKFADAVAALKAHLVNRGYGDLEVNVTGGYDPTSTSADAPLIQAQIATLKKAGIDPVLRLWNPGSYPGYIFTGAPLHLAAGHFGLGHGGGAHAPDEYYVIESQNPNVQGLDGAVMSYVEYLYELAK